MVTLPWNSDLTSNSNLTSNSDLTPNGQCGLSHKVPLYVKQELCLNHCIFILCPQENHHYPRSDRPHGACFQGHHMVIMVSPDQQKPEFKLDCHSNECMLSIKHKVARKLNMPVDHLTMGVSDRWLDSTDNNKLIHQLEFGGSMTLIIKTYGVATGYSRVTEVSRGSGQKIVV